jgi:hypothetical protein
MPYQSAILRTHQWTFRDSFLSAKYAAYGAANIAAIGTAFWNTFLFAVEGSDCSTIVATVDPTLCTTIVATYK